MYRHNTIGLNIHHRLKFLDHISADFARYIFLRFLFLILILGFVDSAGSVILDSHLMDI